MSTEQDVSVVRQGLADKASMIERIAAHEALDRLCVSFGVPPRRPDQFHQEIETWLHQEESA